MNYPITLNQITLDNEEDLLDFLRSQLSRHSKLYFVLHEFHWPIRKTRNHRCSSVDFTFHPGKTFHTEPEESEKQRLPISILVKNPELCQTTENVFNCLIEKYRGSSWTKEGKFLHVAAFKQFCLDCFTFDTTFFKLLLDGVNSKLWISVEGFFKAVESVQRSSSHHFLSFKRYEKKSQKKFLIQKMLFFFCLVQLEVASFISKDNLCRVVSLADKRESTHIRMLVDHYVKLADEFRGSHKDYVGFDEFKAAVLKTLDD